MRIGDADKIGRRTDKHSITCLHENQLQVSDGASVFKFGGVSCSFSAASSLVIGVAQTKKKKNKTSTKARIVIDLISDATYNMGAQLYRDEEK